MQDMCALDIDFLRLDLFCNCVSNFEIKEKDSDNNFIWSFNLFSCCRCTSLADTKGNYFVRCTEELLAEATLMAATVLIIKLMLLTTTILTILIESIIIISIDNNNNSSDAWCKDWNSKQSRNLNFTHKIYYNMIKCFNFLKKVK